MLMFCSQDDFRLSQESATLRKYMYDEPAQLHFGRNNGKTIAL